MKVFISWSGGKETSLALYRVMQNRDVEVAYLLNMVSEDGKYSRTHGISSKLLKLQAEAIGIPIIQRRATWESYERVFKKAVLEFRKKNIQAGVFGDIDLQGHRDWIERVCKCVCIRPTLPLWKEKREKLLKEFINAGFKTVIVATRANLLGKEWLGRRIDKEFIKDLKALGNIDLCGENGEYHTFVYDGPIFKKPVEFSIGKKVLTQPLRAGVGLKDKHWFLKLNVKND